MTESKYTVDGDGNGGGLPTSFPMRVAGGRTVQIPSIGFGTWAYGEIETPIKTLVVD